MLSPTCLPDTAPPTCAEHSVAALQRGEIIGLVESERSGGGGYLVMAPEFATPESAAFMIRHTTGILSVALPAERCTELDLPLMAAAPGASQQPAFTHSVDLCQGTTTGISASDRALTIRALVSPATRPNDLARPGHIFPVVARSGGLLEGDGPVEAAVDLVRTAGLRPAGVMAQLVNDDGTTARGADVVSFCTRRGLAVTSISEVAELLRRTQACVRHAGESSLQTRWGEFRAVSFESLLDRATHCALVRGDVGHGPAVPVWLHRECFPGDILGAVDCGCSADMHAAMLGAARRHNGVVIYLRSPAADRDARRPVVGVCGAALTNEDVDVSAQILLGLGVRAVRMLSNTRIDCARLEAFGLHV